MKAALVFPPATDPRSPHLGCAALAAAVRSAGHEALHVDADLGGLLYVTATDRLAEAARVVCRHRERDAETRRLAAIADELVETTADAFAALRDERFYDPLRYNASRGTILDACALVSAAAPRRVRYGLLPIRYDVDGVDAQRLGHLVAATADPAANLFHDYFAGEVLPALERESPDVVGISIVNRQQVLPGLMLARALRARGHFVVIGGTVYTKFADQLQRRPEFFRCFADAVVVYEGETALVRLLEQRAVGGDLGEVPNLLYLEGGRVRATPVHLEDVAALPTPDFEGLPLDRYLAPAPVLPILTGKGCYYNRCKFCDIPYINHVSPRAYRVRSPERIAEDCATLAARFGCRHFEITDEALAPKLLDQLAAAVPEGAYSFVGYARLEPGFSLEVCGRLARAGFKKLFFGLESACQRTLDHMDKGTDVADAPRVLAACRDAGIRFHLFSIIGFPGEDEASARETFQFFVDHRDLIDHPGNSFDIHSFGLELRTAYFDECGRQGIIDPAALGGDFVIGVPEGGWRNPGGLGPEDVARLLGEFQPALRRLYRSHHNTPEHFWPGFEEYAVLYADRYADRPFPYRTSLPAPDDPGRFALRWAPRVALFEDGESVVLEGRTGKARLSRKNHRFLGRAAARTAAELYGEVAGAVPPGRAGEAARALFGAVDHLVGLGLLEIHTEVRT